MTGRIGDLATGSISHSYAQTTTINGDASDETTINTRRRKKIEHHRNSVGGQGQRQTAQKSRRQVRSGMKLRNDSVMNGDGDNVNVAYLHKQFLHTRTHFRPMLL